MEDLARTIVKELVDDPESVSVSVVDGPNTMIVATIVAKADTGQVIGRNGRTASAIRTILGAVGAKHKKKVIFDIVEDRERIAISHQSPRLEAS